MKQKPDYRAQSQAIDDFMFACEAARQHLPPLGELNTTQRRLILSAALKGLQETDIAYYSRAMELLMGRQDGKATVHGGWLVKKTKIGQIRRRYQDKVITVTVDRV